MAIPRENYKERKACGNCRHVRMLGANAFFCCIDGAEPPSPSGLIVAGDSAQATNGFRKRLLEWGRNRIVSTIGVCPSWSEPPKAVNVEFVD